MDNRRPTRPPGKWVKVEFYGRIPDGETLEDVDLPVVSQTLGATFGFSHVDGLSVVLVTTDEPKPLSP